MPKPPAPTVRDALISCQKATNNESLKENEKFATTAVKRYGHICHIV